MLGLGADCPVCGYPFWGPHGYSRYWSGTQQAVVPIEQALAEADAQLPHQWWYDDCTEADEVADHR